MKLHKNAGLTVKQRKQVKEIYAAGGISYAKLAQRFGVSVPTIEKWVKRPSPEDLKSGPRRPKTVISDAYRKAVLDYRAEHENHGPIRIAFELKSAFAFANRGTVLKILQQARLTRPKGEKKET